MRRGRRSYRSRRRSFGRKRVRAQKVGYRF